MTTLSPTSVFSDTSAADIFTEYDCEIVLRDKIMGGVPADPKLVEGWLRSKAGIDDEAEVMAAMRRTLIERGIEIPANATYYEIISASEDIAAERETTGFKRDEFGLYIEARQVKALIKESVNINFAGQAWGKRPKGDSSGAYRGKSPKNFAAERVFVEPAKIYLGRDEADGIDMIIGHVSGPQGPRSTIGYHEYALQPTLNFHVLSLDDSIKPEWWARIWTHGERNGIGALRSQGHGQFVVTRWERLR